VSRCYRGRRRAARHPQGKAIRFAGDDVREFQSRTSTGVRGMTLKGGDEVISLSILHRVGTTRKSARPICASPRGRRKRKASRNLTPERFAELAEREQFILTVCANGYGKLSSAYEYRRTNRGGQGITNIDNIASPQRPDAGRSPASPRDCRAPDQLMLVTDQAKLIRLRALGNPSLAARDRPRQSRGGRAPVQRGETAANMSSHRSR
jgi:DNA gyrase subunit A